LHSEADNSPHLNTSTSNCSYLRRAIRIWLVSLLLCILAVKFTFVYVDVEVTHRVVGFFKHTKEMATGLSSLVLLGIEASVVLTLVVLRIIHGRLTPFLEASALACLTSICSYAVCDSILKPLFGVVSPMQVLLGERHSFHLFSGVFDTSFPSGHMVLASAFSAVFMRLYRSSIPPLAVLLVIASGLLVLGDWHFVSDVIAGTFIGLTVGLLAGELWIAHKQNMSTR